MFVHQSRTELHEPPASVPGRRSTKPSHEEREGMEGRRVAREAGPSGDLAREVTSHQTREAARGGATQAFATGEYGAWSGPPVNTGRRATRGVRFVSICLAIRERRTATGREMGDCRGGARWRRAAAGKDDGGRPPGMDTEDNRWIGRGRPPPGRRRRRLPPGGRRSCGLAGDGDSSECKAIPSVEASYRG
jgi:hypothetical protein